MSKPKKTSGQVYLALIQECAVIHEKRKDRYGPFGPNMERLARAWSRTLNHTVRPAQVAMMLVELKLDRIKQTPGYADSYLDAVNYLLFAASLEVVSNPTQDKAP